MALLAMGMLLLGTSAAQADYGGSKAITGARYDYTVKRLTTGAAEIVGTIRDTSAADGLCAYVKVSIAVDFAVDPASSGKTCGFNTTKKIQAYTIAPDRVQEIKIQVCLVKVRTLLPDQLKNCSTSYVTRQTT